MAYAHLSKIELGERALTDEWMVRIARSLRIMPADLLPLTMGGLDDRERELIEFYRVAPDILRRTFDAIIHANVEAPPDEPGSKNK